MSMQGATIPTAAGASPWMQAMLWPGSVALVGVSDAAAKTAGRPLHFLRRAGWQGTVYPVNPHRDSVQGQPAWPDLASLPERPDHVFILTGAEIALATLAECNRLSVPLATILAGGFSEAGPEGAANQAALARLVRAGPTRVLGPSSIGVANPHTGLALTANAGFADGDLPRGGVFVASHSGSLIGALLSRGKLRGAGFSGLVSVGGEVDLSIGEICAATLDRPEIDSYLLFLESLAHADHLRAFAQAAAARGKPVAAYKLGRTEAGAELTLTHTGALAGSDAVAEAFLRDCGIARVDAFDTLVDIAPLLGRIAPARRDRPARIGVVTTTGGGAAMAVDRLALRGLDIVAPTPETCDRLRAAGIDAGVGRILDLTLAGTRYEVMKPALDILRAAPEFDLVLATVGSSARFNPDLAVRPIIDAATADTAATPLAAYLVPDAPEALRALAAAGVPALATPETCADAIAAAFARRPPRLAEAPPLPTPARPSRLLDEAAAYGLLDGAGIKHAPFVLLDPGATPPDLPFDYPVAAKLMAPGIAHKSDIGGVALDLPDAPALTAAMARIVARAEAAVPGPGPFRILVQPMIRGLGEMLVGIRRDPQVGPIVVLSAGGIAAELHRDTSLRLAPIDRETAREMIAEVRATRLLTGFRGRPSGDLDALAGVLVAMSKLAAGTHPEVTEAEVNPLVVMADGQGAVAVDALFRLSQD